MAAEVRAEMARQRVSQTALAEKLEVSQPYISRRLTGDVSFDVDELAAVAEALDVPLEQFLMGAVVPEGTAHESTPARRKRSTVPPGRRGRRRRRPLDQLGQTDSLFE